LVMIHREKGLPKGVEVWEAEAGDNKKISDFFSIQ
jgi:hypothetical protein